MAEVAIVVFVLAESVGVPYASAVAVAGFAVAAAVVGNAETEAVARAEEVPPPVQQHEDCTMMDSAGKRSHSEAEEQVEDVAWAL